MDEEETSNDTESAEDQSLAHLIQLGVDNMEDFDMNLASSETRSPGSHGGYDQELNFDTQGLRLNGSTEMASPGGSHKSHRRDSNSRQGDEDLADFCYLFRNQDATDRERAGVGTPNEASSFLLMKNERSDVDVGGGGLDVETLDDGPFLRQQSERVDTELTEEADHPAKPKAEAENEKTPPSPAKKAVPSKPRAVACDSDDKQGAQLTVSPCCANPQSPAASEPGSPTGRKADGESQSKTSSKQSSVEENNVILKVANPLISPSTPGQDTLVSPVDEALAPQKHHLPCSGGDLGDATSSSTTAVLPAPVHSPIPQTPRALSRELRPGRTPEDIDRCDVASILSSFKELSPGVAFRGCAVDGKTRINFPNMFTPISTKLAPSKSSNVVRLFATKPPSPGVYITATGSTGSPSHDNTVNTATTGVCDEAAANHAASNAESNNTTASSGEANDQQSGPRITGQSPLSKGNKSERLSSGPTLTSAQTAFAAESPSINAAASVPTEVSESTENDSGDSDHVGTDIDGTAPQDSEFPADESTTEGTTTNTEQHTKRPSETEVTSKTSVFDGSIVTSETQVAESSMQEEEMLEASPESDKAPGPEKQDAETDLQDEMDTDPALDEDIRASPHAPATSATGQSEAVESPQDSDDQESSSDSDDESVSGEAYLQRVNKRRRTNRDIMSSIFGGSSQRASSSDPQLARMGNSDTKHLSPGFRHGSKAPGMLFPTSALNDPLTSDAPLSTACIYDHLYSLYPHREKEIEVLCSLMGISIRQANALNESRKMYTPASIFVSGPSGVGKTSVVLDILKAFKKVSKAHDSPWRSADSSSTHPIIGSAYVNCAAVGPGSIDTIVESAFGQLLEGVNSPHASSTRQNRKDESKKARRRERSFGESTDDTLPPPEHFEEESDRDMEEMIEAERTKSTGAVERASKGLERKAKSASLRPRDSSAWEKQLDGESRQLKERTSLHAVPMAFGRALVPFFGTDVNALATPDQRGCAFLVLDNGERLLSLSASKSERSNFLAQLLMIPQVMGLNLTVIVVSRSTLLDCSRVNNAVPPQRGLGTIKEAIRPVPIHFSAYRGKEVFKDILQQPKLKRRILGLHDSEKETKNLELQERVYDSFLNVLTDSLLSSTRDLRDFLRMGRLWPTYIAPLQSSRIAATLEAIRSKNCGGVPKTSASENPTDSAAIRKDLLVFLDQSILPRLRSQLENGSFFVKSEAPVSNVRGARTDGSEVDDVPYLSKCLVLASFICQANKPDMDHQLLTNQRRGTRSKRKRGDVDGRGIGSRALEQQQQSLLRPRTFALERMLSVFVNMTGLLQGESKLVLKDHDAGIEGLLRSMGTDVFFESLSHLRELGFLRDVGSGSDGSRSIDLASTKYWCPMTIDEAEEMAKSIDFPLQRFLI